MHAKYAIGSYLLQVDNITKDIKYGINLPVLEWTDYTSTKKYLAADLDFGVLNLPLNNISLWKISFNNVWQIFVLL